MSKWDYNQINVLIREGEKNTAITIKTMTYGSHLRRAIQPEAYRHFNKTLCVSRLEIRIDTVSDYSSIGKLEEAFARTSIAAFSNILYLKSPTERQETH